MDKEKNVKIKKLTLKQIKKLKGGIAADTGHTNSFCFGNCGSNSSITASTSTKASSSKLIGG